MSHFRLDARGLLCPLPVIRTQDKVAELALGDTLEIIATDPGAMHDIPAWCRIHGHEIISQKQDGTDYLICVKVSKKNDL